MNTRSRFLIASSDSATAESLGAILFDADFAGRRVTSGAEALSELERGAYDVVIADHDLDDASGFLLPAALIGRGIEVPVVVLVRDDAPGDGVSAVRAGAVDFLRKPVERDEVLYVLRKALKSAAVDADEPPRSIAIVPSIRLIGGSEPMQELARTLRRVANGVATVLVRGESGTGKELVARLVHELSPRRGTVLEGARRGAAGPTARERALRLRAWRIHGRDCEKARTRGAFRRGHAVLGRDR
jgi:DNA-binding NtrC family response regulator